MAMRMLLALSMDTVALNPSLCGTLTPISGTPMPCRLEISSMVTLNEATITASTLRRRGSSSKNDMRCSVSAMP